MLCHRAAARLGFWPDCSVPVVELARADLLHDSRDQPWSEAERELHRLYRRAGISGWATNVPIAGTPFWADVCFERVKVIVEVDGWETHGNRAAFEADRARRNRLELAGYLVLNVTWRQITEQPEAVLAWTRQALAGNDRSIARGSRR